MTNVEWTFNPARPFVIPIASKKKAAGETCG
jgi:hypothetical protein